MKSISILATVIAIFSSIAKVEGIHAVGNLDLCLPNSGNGETDERLCLTPDGVMEEQSSEETAFQFEYDNGLLRAPGTNLCLGPAYDVLNRAYDKPYELFLQECPSDDDEEHDTVREYESWFMTHSRHMRFIITQEGRVESLAEVQHPWTVGDDVSKDPYCLAMRQANTDTHERAYLVQCDDETIETKEFDVYGTYSGSFLMPLQCVWASQEVVDLAFQIGLPSTEAAETTSTDSPFVEITTLWPVNGKTLVEMLVDVIPLDSRMTGGIISLEPFGSNFDGYGFQIDGTLTATLRSTQGDDDIVLSQASFWVSESVDRPATRAPMSSYYMYLYIVGLFIACFLLSVIFEKICLRRTRSEGDLSNDGKTVCISVEEEEDDDFPLEEDNVDNVEEGYGVIHICVSKEDTGTASDTDTDIDESRTSARTDIPREDTDSE